jgi:hypothetical protein
MVVRRALNSTGLSHKNTLNRRPERNAIFIGQISVLYEPQRRPSSALGRWRDRTTAFFVERCEPRLVTGLLPAAIARCANGSPASPSRPRRGHKPASLCTARAPALGAPVPAPARPRPAPTSALGGPSRVPAWTTLSVHSHAALSVRSHTGRHLDNTFSRSRLSGLSGLMHFG